MVDHRDVKLQAVKLRYGEEKFHKVSEIPIMSYEELCAMLGVTEHILQGTDVCVKFRNADELILSPSRKKRKCERYVHVFLWQQIYISNNMYLKKNKISHSMDVNKYGFLVICRVYPHLQDRENAATPSIEDNSAIMEESAMSGYYGDRDEDSFQEYDGKIFSQFLLNLCADVKVQKVFKNCVFLLIMF